jgi:hypothetical protein
VLDEPAHLFDLELADPVFLLLFTKLLAQLIQPLLARLQLLLPSAHLNFVPLLLLRYLDLEGRLLRLEAAKVLLLRDAGRLALDLLLLAVEYALLDLELLDYALVLLVLLLDLLDLLALRLPCLLLPLLLHLELLDLLLPDAQLVDQALHLRLELLLVGHPLQRLALVLVLLLQLLDLLLQVGLLLQPLP